MAAVVVLEMGLGLLLFVSPGLLPALTTVVAAYFAALATGLALAGPGRRSGSLARWPWLLAVGTLSGAAVASLGWSFDGGVPASAGSRGVYLSLLVVAPGLGLGAALAGLGGRPRGRWGAAASAAGGAGGAVVLGVVLVPRFEPASVYLFCVLCVALAALMEGSGRTRPAPKEAWTEDVGAEGVALP